MNGRVRKRLGLSKQKYPGFLDRMDTISSKFLLKLLSFYVHPVVVGDNIAQVNNSGARGGQVAQERHRAEAELRTVFTIFIMPLIEAKLVDSEEKNRQTFQLLNDIMNVTTSILDSFEGHLRQFIVDDKGGWNMHFRFPVFILW